MGLRRFVQDCSMIMINYFINYLHRSVQKRGWSREARPLRAPSPAHTRPCRWSNLCRSCRAHNLQHHNTSDKVLPTLCRRQYLLSVISLQVPWCCVCCFCCRKSPTVDSLKTCCRRLWLIFFSTACFLTRLFCDILSHFKLF